MIEFPKLSAMNEYENIAANNRVSKPRGTPDNEFVKSYPVIVKNVMEYLIERKTLHPNAALFDLISDYCVKRNVPHEVVGDAIASDEYIVSFLETDMLAHQGHGLVQSLRHAGTCTAW